MDPLFELAGMLLVQCDEEWVPKTGEPWPRVEPGRGRVVEPTLRPDETIDVAIAACKAAIAEVKALEAKQKPPAAREPKKDSDAAPSSGAEGEQEERPGTHLDSLLVRRELLTERLYNDRRLALSAVRAIERYPSYIVDIYQDVADETKKPGNRLTSAIAASDSRLDGLQERFAPTNAIADRLLVDRAFAVEATRLLELPQPFVFVLQCELDEIARSRKARLEPYDRHARSMHSLFGPPAPPTPPRAGYPQHSVRSAFDMQLFGLALSGGGIRSATFGLGVLQALSDLDLLRHVDYLSSVSGGGYIASWLLGWIKRLRGGVHEVQQRLCPQRAPHPNAVEARPLRMLREFSNYLTPRVGFLSGDTWTMVVIWLRNTLLNLLVIVALLIALLVIPRWIVPFSFAFGDSDLLRIFVLTIFVAVGFAARNIAGVYDANSVAMPSSGPQPEPQGHASGMVTASIVIPVVTGSFAAAAWMAKVSGGIGGESAASSLPFALRALKWILTLDWLPLLPAFTDWVVAKAPSWGATLPQQWLDVWLSEAEQTALFVGTTLMFAGLVFIQFVGGYARCIVRSRGRDSAVFVTNLRLLVWAAIAAVVGGLLTAMLLRLVNVFPADGKYWFVAAFIPPLLTETLALTVALHIGLLGRFFPDERREWWSRLGAQQLLISSMWTIAFACTIFAPSILSNLYASVPAAVTWVVTTWGGVIIAKAGETSGKTEGGSPKWREYLALVAPYVFIIGLLLGISGLIHQILVAVDDPARTSWSAWTTFDHRDAQTPFWICALASGLCALLSWRVDVNEFSMHHFYKNRLVRCYLGASRDQAERRPNVFTGFDPEDDVKLSDLRLDPGPDTPTAEQSLRRRGLPYLGPYPIVNVALNLTKGRELAWQERKAESFVFTPQFSGYELTEDRPIGGKNLGRAGYRRTSAFAYVDGPATGTVAAISGAAANPNMGYHSSPATAFLLTVFNARLGWWLGNPRFRLNRLERWRLSSPWLGTKAFIRELTRRSKRLEPWRTSSPRLGLMYLLSELTGGSDNRTKYINVSDGGHFENLGIYELVRRRCKYIIAVDAEQDGSMSFNGLANAIRKCRTDFGVSIELDLSDLRRDGRRSRAHCTAGRIYYPEPDAMPGHILYIKSSLTGDEPPDVLEYESRSNSFPHESTGDQWFDESQFESYRMLGYHVGREALTLPTRTAADLNHGTVTIAGLFDQLRDLWTPAAGLQQEDRFRHSELYSALYATAHERVPAGTADTLLFAVPPAIANRDTLYVAQAMIEFMHRVFTDLRLDRFPNRPHNAGWMRIFQEWVRDANVISTWTRVESKYSQRFRSFIEQLRTWRPGGGFD